jgi:regulator of sirC expression with transglutaminase-like and TPR domain
MKLGNPVCCNEGAFALLQENVEKISTVGGLLPGSLAIAMHDHPFVPALVLDKIEDLAQRATGCHSPKGQSAMMQLVLFDEEQYRIPMKDPEHRCWNSLPMVLEHKCGVPPALALLYKIIADEIKLPVEVLNRGGHYFIGIGLKGAGDVVDKLFLEPSFGGKSFTLRERDSLCGGKTSRDKPEKEEIMSISNAVLLGRILFNYACAYASLRRYADQAAMYELWVLIMPDDPYGWRNLAESLKRAGHRQVARKLFRSYIDSHPQIAHKQNLWKVLRMLNS